MIRRADSIRAQSYYAVNSDEVEDVEIFVFDADESEEDQIDLGRVVVSIYVHNQFGGRPEVATACVGIEELTALRDLLQKQIDRLKAD